MLSYPFFQDMEEDGQLACEVDVQVKQLITLKASHPQALPDVVAALPEG